MARAKRWEPYTRVWSMIAVDNGDYVENTQYAPIETLASQHGWNPDGEQTACEFLAAFMAELTTQFHAAQDLHVEAKREIARLKREAEVAKRAVLNALNECSLAGGDESDVEIFLSEAKSQLDAEQKEAPAAHL